MKLMRREPRLIRYENAYLEIVLYNDANRREQPSNNREERSKYREIDAERTKSDEIYIYGEGIRWDFGKKFPESRETISGNPIVPTARC